MKLIVGLGNPGKEYENTRHNAGFKFIDYLKESLGLSFSNKFSSLYAELNSNGEKIIFLKPQTFMNDSGKAVLETIKFYKIPLNDTFIAFDDLDIKEGEYKIQQGHYPKVHNGINDILYRLGDDQFNFIRIGVDGRNQTERKLINGRDYVLQKTQFDFDKVFKYIKEDISNRYIKLS